MALVHADECYELGKKHGEILQAIFDANDKPQGTSNIECHLRTVYEENRTTFDEVFLTIGEEHRTPQSKITYARGASFQELVKRGKIQVDEELNADYKAFRAKGVVVLDGDNIASSFLMIMVKQ